MNKVIVFTNQKGGVAKTTSAIVLSIFHSSLKGEKDNIREIEGNA